MDEQSRNMFLAIILSLVVFVVWSVMFPPQLPPETLVEDGVQQSEQMNAPVAPNQAADAGAREIPETVQDVQEVELIGIESARLSGHISTRGGRIEKLMLSDYRVSIDADAQIVQLLEPYSDQGGYYAVHGWAPGQGLSGDLVPGPNTIWQQSAGDVLRPGAPVQLVWDNGAGLLFTRDIAMDDNYMFEITQSVQSSASDEVSLAPYGFLARHGEPEDLKKFFILHEGLVQIVDGTKTETSYSNMTEYDFAAKEGALAEVAQATQNGWIGFTDHYWMTALIPNPGQAHKSVAKYDQTRDVYQAEVVLPTHRLSPGAAHSVSTKFFAGAKEWEQIQSYQEQGIERFTDSIDWGWFYFLTRPMFRALHFFNEVIGNMGWSIIALTLAIKSLVLPLAYKSYVSMAKMKELQPQMEKIRDAAKDDKQKMQRDMMELYKKEKVNPAAGCLPILVQIPIFFSLYKVIFVTLELRHAPWIAWIRDLSAPDPTSILNLFGLLSFSPPDPGSFLSIISLGVLPILLGISMWLQQKLNPTPPDPTQAMIFAWMPWVFMFMLGQFASGLIIYWIANNVITFAQQYAIMSSQGAKPDLWGNIKGSKKAKDNK